MGWHPSAPEYANFPNKPESIWWKRKIRRGGAGRGTPKNKKPPGNSGGVGRKNRPSRIRNSLLAKQAMDYGFLNGKRLPGRKVRT